MKRAARTALTAAPVDTLFRPVVPRAGPRRWLVALPLVALLGTASARLFHEARSPGGSAPDRFGRMSRAEAAALAGSLCARLTGGQCDLLDVSARASPPMPKDPPLREWDVLCQARTGPCSLQIDADSKELLVFQRDAGHASASRPAAGGERGVVTPAETERYARHYLALAGLTLPSGARRLPTHGTAIVYECDGSAPGGKSRLLQVRVDRTDASLECLINRPFHPFHPAVPPIEAPPRRWQEGRRAGAGNLAEGDFSWTPQRIREKPPSCGSGCARRTPSRGTGTATWRACSPTSGRPRTRGRSSSSRPSAS